MARTGGPAARLHKQVVVLGPPCTGPNAGASGPVICLPDGFGEDKHAPLSIGGSVLFGAQVINNGPAVDDAEVVLTLPETLRSSPDFAPTRFEDWWDDNSDDNGTPLDCSTSSDERTVTCSVGHLDEGANILIGIGVTSGPTATSSSPPATFTVALNSQASATPKPNEVQATVDFVGKAKLTLSVDPDHATVTVGKSTTLTATVHNSGPDPAPNSYLFGADFAGDGGAPHFSITNSAPLPGLTSASGAARTFAIAGDPGDVGKPSFGFWPLDTIGVGESASTAVIVKALTAGTDELGLNAGSEAIDQDCDLGDGGADSSSSASAGSSSASAGSSSASAVSSSASAGSAPAAAAKLMPRRIRGHKVTAQQAGICDDFVLVDLEAVAPAPVTSTTPTSSTPTAPTTTETITTAAPTATITVTNSSAVAAGGGALANTGPQQTRPMVLASVLAIVAGIALCIAGRRRSASARSSHR